MIFSFKSTINTGNDNLTETKIQQSHDPYLLYTDNYVYTCTCVCESTYTSLPIYLCIYLFICLCVYVSIFIKYDYGDYGQVRGPK